MNESTNYKRNIMITKSVLRGWTCKYMGIYFGLTGSTILKIVYGTIRKNIPMFLDMYIGSQPLEYCRRHKDHLIKLLEKENENSSPSTGKDSKHPVP